MAEKTPGKGLDRKIPRRAFILGGVVGAGAIGVAAACAAPNFLSPAATGTPSPRPPGATGTPPPTEAATTQTIAVKATETKGPPPPPKPIPSVFTGLDVQTIQGSEGATTAGSIQGHDTKINTFLRNGVLAGFGIDDEYLTNTYYKAKMGPDGTVLGKTPNGDIVRKEGKVWILEKNGAINLPFVPSREYAKESFGFPIITKDGRFGITNPNGSLIETRELYRNAGDIARQYGYNGDPGYVVRVDVNSNGNLVVYAADNQILGNLSFFNKAEPPPVAVATARPTEVPLEKQPVAAQAAAAFATALTGAGMKTSPEMVIGQGFAKKEVMGKDGKKFTIATSQDGYPLMIMGEGGVWKGMFFSNAAKIKGVDVVVRNSANKEAVLKVATSIKMEIGDVTGLYNSNFDWTKVTGDWENIKSELKQGKIPFTSEIFDPGKLAMVKKDIEFAKNNNLSFVGDCLFYPSILQNSAVKNLTADNQKKVILFMAAAKLLEFPEISKIDLAAEIAAYQMWRSGEFNGPFSKLGETGFLVELATFAKQIKPEVKLMMTEDMMIDGRTDVSDFNRHYQLFFDLIKSLKAKKAQIDGVKFENTLWVGSPPTEASILKPINEAKVLGYEIEAPDLIIGLGAKSPIWTNWGPTVDLKNETEMIKKQAEIYSLVLKTYLKAGVNNFGFHSVTDDKDWLKASSNLFTSTGTPKLSEFQLTKTMLETV